MTEFLPNHDVIVVTGIVILSMVLPLLLRGLGRLVRAMTGNLRAVPGSHS